MSDECARFRESVTRGGMAGDHALACARCAAFVKRWTTVDRELTAVAGATPPPDFVSRVRSRLPEPLHPVVAISMRVLPATLTLLVVAGLWIAVTDAIGVAEPPGSTDDYLEWVVDDVLADASLAQGDAR